MKVLLAAAYIAIAGLCACGTASENGNKANEDSLKKEAAHDQEAAVAAEETAPWVFEEIGKGPADEPLTRVSVSISKRPYVVAKSVSGNCNLLEKAQWPVYKIPASAISACMSWWAGAGDIFYLIEKKGTHQVMHAEIGEGMDPEKDTQYKSVLEVNDPIK
jgi:hypothetical protein